MIVATNELPLVSLCNVSVTFDFVYVAPSSRFWVLDDFKSALLHFARMDISNMMNAIMYKKPKIYNKKLYLISKVEGNEITIKKNTGGRVHVRKKGTSAYFGPIR